MAKVTAKLTIPPAEIDAVYTLVRPDDHATSTKVNPPDGVGMAFAFNPVSRGPHRRRVYLGAGPEYRVIRQD